MRGFDPNRLSKINIPALWYILLWFKSAQKDLLNSEWKDEPFLTDRKNCSLLVPRTLTSVSVRVEGRGIHSIRCVYASAFGWSNVLTSFKRRKEKRLIFL